MVKSRNEICLEQSNVQNAEPEENYFGDSSSVCSDEASNYPEEQQLVSNLKTKFERRRRNASNKYKVARKNKLLKKKGTAKLDEKMRILQKLIPNSINVDKACVLDEAIVYIKVLQNQLQFIWSANAFTAGLYNSLMQPTLPRPNMMHQFYATSLIQNDTFSSLPVSIAGSGIQMPHAGMILQQPSLMSNSSASFSPYGTIMNFQ